MKGRKTATKTDAALEYGFAVVQHGVTWLRWCRFFKLPFLTASFGGDAAISRRHRVGGCENRMEMIGLKKVGLVSGKL